MLLEGLVAMAISGALGLGMVYGAAKVVAAQRYASTQNMAVFSMRNLLRAPVTAASAAASGTFTLSLKNIDAAGNAATASTQTLSYTRSCPTTTATISVVGAASAAVTATKSCTMATVSDAISKAVLGGCGVLSFGQSEAQQCQ